MKNVQSWMSKNAVNYSYSYYYDKNGILIFMNFKLVCQQC